MRSRHLAVIATLVSALACGGDQSSDESLLVDVDLSENQATVARAYPVGERLLPRGHREQLLRYELRSGDELITHGVISDPRWARYEVINPDGSMSDELEYIGRGRVTLRLPRRTGELVFFAENQQGNDLVEVSRALFDPSTQEVDDEVVRTGFAATRGRTVQALRPDDENPVPSFCRVSDGNTRCVDLIAGSGSEVLNLDIAFVPAGFSGADDPGFRATARRVAQQMLAEEDFGKYQSRVNFWVYTGAG
ncbi:MAG: hypothetical protein KJO07_08690, partial [Deltaproteobacteria bacterium]|nr:hypothetical protein [Deltaproteobacteria bacterium]